MSRIGRDHVHLTIPFKHYYCYYYVPESEGLVVKASRLQVCTPAHYDADPALFCLQMLLQKHTSRGQDSAVLQFCSSTSR